MINVDNNMHELVKHGTTSFPFAIYKDSYNVFNDKYYYMHYHEELEIIITIKGKINVTVNNNIYNLDEHEFLLINSNNLHNIRHNDYPDSIVYAIVFSKRLIEINKTTIIETNIINNLFERKFEAVKIKDDDFYNEIKQNYSSIKDNENGYQLLIVILLLKLFYKIYINYDKLEIKENNSKNNERIRAAIDYITKNYDNYINVTDIAKICNMSVGETSRLFKKIVRKAPIEYLIEFRIKIASTLLIKTDMNITEIATSTGFSSPNYFTISFKKNMGLTPKEYRKKMKNLE